MACNFSIPVTGNPDAALARAKSAVQGQGGTFNGDANSGQFHVSVMGNTIAGSYTVVGSNLEIVITDKPFLIPCSTIEGYLKSQIGG